MSLKVCLLNVFICTANAYFLSITERCPGQSVERHLRGKAVCPTVEDYHCLLDEHKIKKEICHNYIQLPKGNYPKYSSITDNIYYEECPEHQFQPGPPKSFQVTECISIKSKCASEGQKPYQKGNESSDILCRCDYKKGFAYINRKYCLPFSLDDCSCYRKECPTNQELDSDNNCIGKCPHGFEREEATHNCISIQRGKKLKHSSNGSNATEEQFSFEYSYALSTTLLVVALCLFVLQVPFMLILTQYTGNLRPFRYKLFPYLFLCAGFCVCFALGIFYKESKAIPIIILSICLIEISCWFGAIFFTVCTNKMTKVRVVYNEEYSFGVFKLLQEAAKGSMDGIKLLKHEDYIDLEDTDSDRRSALHLAAIEGQTEIVEYLLGHDLCYPLSRDRWNRTAAEDIILHMEGNGKDSTLKENHANIIKNLEKHIEDQGQQPLKTHFRERQAKEVNEAAAEGKIRHLRRLCKKGMDMNISDFTGRTPLHAAVEMMQFETVKFLINDCNVCPFVKWQNKRPIDVLPIGDYKKTHDIRTVLTDAMSSKNKQKTLSDCRQFQCADDDLKCHRVLQAAAIGDMYHLELYKQAGYPMNVADFDKRTPLHVAVSNKQEHVVEYLLSLYGCSMLKNVSAKDRWGATPLSSSTKSGYEDVYRVFLENCPELVVTENDQYKTYRLLKASAEGDERVLQELYNTGFDMNSQDYYGRTALHLAEAEPQTAAINFLLDIAKVKPDFRDSDDRKPFTGREGDLQATRASFPAPKISRFKETMITVNEAASRGYLCKIDDVRFKYCSMDSYDYYDNTPLHVAVVKGRFKDVKYLLDEKNVSPFIRNSNRKTPLDLAEEKIKYWRNKKEHLYNRYTEIKTALQNAMQFDIEKIPGDETFKNHDATCKAFLIFDKAFKGDIKSIISYWKAVPSMLCEQTYDKRTILHIAAREGHEHLVKFILEKAENKIIKAEDRWNCTALDEAIKNGYTNIEELIKNA